MFHPNFEKAWKYSLFMKNPKERAGSLSRLAFSFMDAFMKTGYRRVLESSDLQPLMDDDKTKELTCRLEQTWAAEIRNSHVRHRKARLSRAMLKTLPWSEYAWLGLALFVRICCRISQPVLLGLLLSALPGGEGASAGRVWLVYLYAALLLVSVLLHVVAANHYHNRVQLMGMRWRAAAAGLAFKKVGIPPHQNWLFGLDMI